MPRFPVRDWRDAEAAAAEGPRDYERCPAQSPDGTRCDYGRDHVFERHSWEVGR